MEDDDLIPLWKKPTDSWGETGPTDQFKQLDHICIYDNKNWRWGILLERLPNKL